MDTLLDELLELAHKFRDSGYIQGKLIAICLFTTLGATNQGGEHLENLSSLCAEFSAIQKGGMTN